MEKEYYIDTLIQCSSVRVSQSSFFECLESVRKRSGEVSVFTSHHFTNDVVSVVDDFRFTDSYGKIHSFAHSVYEVTIDD